MVVIKDTNRIPDIIPELDKLGQKTLKVGIFGNAPSGGKNITMVELANIHEFGTMNGHIPARSFVRSTFAEQTSAWQNMAVQLVGKVARGEIKADQAYKQLGARITRDVQRKITDLKSPPNAQSTIKQKGSANPLIDTGAMRASVTWEVE